MLAGEKERNIWKEEECCQFDWTNKKFEKKDVVCF